MKLSWSPSSLLSTLLLASVLPSALAAPAPVEVTGGNGKKLATFADVFGGQFRVSRTNVFWLESGNSTEDGTYVTQDGSGSLIFQNIASGATETFVDAASVGVNQDDVWDWYIQPERKYVLYATNYTKQYRYSFFANYFIYDREAKTTVPLVADQHGDIQYAGWAPKGNVIAFVRANDLYIWKDGVVSRVTTDGGPDVFNAVPDWVYEEEVYGDVKTLWFSPDAEYLAFLKFNETGVPTYTIPYYMAGQQTAPPYPEELDLRYPKVGETNPTVTFNLLSLKDTSKVDEVSFDTFARNDLLITEVAWVAEKHESVIFRTTNRVQDLEKLVLVDVETRQTKIVRERDATDGWLEPAANIQYVPGLAKPSYIDQSDESGWNHIYLHSVDGSSKPIALTSGNWEVTAVLKIDEARGKVYYLSTERHSTERHLFSVGLDGKGKTALIDAKKEGYWTASFSSGGKYYILSYNGPDIPYQKLYSVDSSTALQTLQDNKALADKLAEYKLPKTEWSELALPDGTKLNVIEILPPNFDRRKKYPIIFRPYGGPNSQQTGKSFIRTVNWNAYVASDPELEYITLVVDNRGTGFKGRKFRSLVTKQLGKLEAEDQVFAAKEWAKKSYVDGNKVAMWGWSYGGYLTSKVLELDSGAFTLGLITAPVSDWRFYDTIYTERYMKTLSGNKAGYDVSAVVKADGFKNVKGGFLIQHGTGDDNVHFQNTAALVDTLINQKVSPAKLDSQFFTDSDHNINLRGAQDFLYKQLADKLYDEKVRKDTKTKHQWE